MCNSRVLECYNLNGNQRGRLVATSAPGGGRPPVRSVSPTVLLMNVSTRLILVLTLAVGAVMIVASLLVLREREAALEAAMRQEVRVLAAALQASIEEDYAGGRTEDARRLINRLSANAETYAAVLFNGSGNLLMASEALTGEEMRRPPQLSSVLTTGEPSEFVSTVAGQRVFSVIVPLHVGAAHRGAIEVVHPLSFIERDIRRTRLNWAVTTVLLLLTIFAVVSFVMSRSLKRPISELLGGAAAIGQGDLNYRVIVPRAGGEFTQLAHDFNRMADRLAEQRRAAESDANQRLALERTLRHSERLAAVGRLAAGVAHGMGAPLNVIDARAEQLLQRADAPLEVQQRNLTIIRKQVERITRTVRQLLNLARPYELHREVVNLGELVGGTLDQMEANAAREGVEIDFTCDRQPVLAELDQEFVRQVFMNVLGNALQAMPGGGRLRVELVKDAEVKDGRSFGAVRISDTGDGMPPEHLAHVFDPFYTTREVGEGTGIGLSVALRIVEEHGGWIDAANNGEGGATFSIYLPQCGSTSARPSENSMASSERLNERAAVNR